MHYSGSVTSTITEQRALKRKRSSESSGGDAKARKISDVAANLSTDLGEKEEALDVSHSETYGKGTELTSATDEGLRMQTGQDDQDSLPVEEQRSYGCSVM